MFTAREKIYFSSASVKDLKANEFYSRYKIGPDGLVVMMWDCGSLEASSIPAPGPIIL